MQWLPCDGKFKVSDILLSNFLFFFSKKIYNIP